MSMFDSIRRTDQLTYKNYFVIEEVLSLLGVARSFTMDMVPGKAKTWLRDNGMDERKVFQSNLGDWIVTESCLVAVVASLLPFHGNREKIMEAKVELGLIDPPTPPAPTLAISRREEHEAEDHSNALAVFSYGASQVRTHVIDGEPWFVAKDVCDVLGIAKARNAVALLDNDEKDALTVGTLGGTQEMLIINEPGLYSLILRSRKPEAKAFKRWITHEVIPSIRKTGSYSVTPAPALPQDYKSALVALLAEVEKTEQQQVIILELAPKAEFHDKVADATNCHTFQEAGKILGIGQNRLFKLCYENSILMKKSRLPYQRFNDSGYFKIIEEVYAHPKTGEQRVGYKTLITGKGLTWLEKEFFRVKEAA